MQKHKHGVHLSVCRFRPGSLTHNRRAGLRPVPLGALCRRATLGATLERRRRKLAKLFPKRMFFFLQNRRIGHPAAAGRVESTTRRRGSRRRIRWYPRWGAQPPRCFARPPRVVFFVTASNFTKPFFGRPQVILLATPIDTPELLTVRSPRPRQVW